MTPSVLISILVAVAVAISLPAMLRNNYSRSLACGTMCTMTVNMQKNTENSAAQMIQNCRGRVAAFRLNPPGVESDTALS